MSTEKNGLFYCDVCDHTMIPEMLGATPLRSFHLTGFPEKLHCHKNCESILREAVKTLDTKILPEGSHVAEMLTKIKEQVPQTRSQIILSHQQPRSV